MALKTKVGQIFLEHPKDENYSSIYEESFSKDRLTLELFAAIEISEPAKINQVKNQKTEYDALAKMIVAAFKKTYVSAPQINEDTFERALATINSALGKLGAKGKVNWFGKLNVALASFYNNELCLATTGNAVVYMIRASNPSLLSENLSEDSKPVKIFSNYASGKLQKNDRVIVSTKQLFNYLSLDKIRELLQEEDLDEICHEVISGLSDIKNVGFATFIFETISDSGAAQSVEKSVPFKAETAKTAVPKNKALAYSKIAWMVLKRIVEFVINVLQFIFGFIYSLIAKRTRPGSRKPMILTVGLIVLLLALSIGFSAWKRSSGKLKEIENSNLRRAEETVNAAEAAAIYQDDQMTLGLVQDAQTLLSEVKSGDNQTRVASLNDRIKNLRDKINKETIIENPTLLSTFPMIPTDIIHEPNGVLAFNRNTGVLAFYDFRNGETKEILENKNTSSFVLGENVGGIHGYVFFERNGRFAKVDLAANTYIEYMSENPNLAEVDKAKIQDMAILGEGNNARIYLLDTNQNQIWRFRITDDATIGLAERWLKNEAALADARDITIDNNIYLLFPDRLDRYFNGSKQNFSLSSVTPAIQKAARVFTDTELQMIYILEPENERILVYDKNGKLQNQLKSTKLRDAADFHVDEKNKFIYIVSGQELLQINY